MVELPAHRLRDAFEFADGARRIAIVRGGPRGLPPSQAATLVHDRVIRDWFFRTDLAHWYRRVEITAGHGDDQRMIAAVLREVESGWLQVHELDRPASTYVPAGSRAEPRAPREPHPSPEPSSFDSDWTEPESAINEFDPALDEPSKVVERVVEHLAVGDFNFCTGHAVMLPGPSVEGEREGDHADGIALIAGLLAHLRSVEERRVMVAGHTDAVGSFADNIQLSERRAQSVKLACEGNADGFASHAAVHGDVADGQEVLRWISLRFGWSCDPGPVDGKSGAKTSAARSHFRERVKAEFGVSAGTGSTFERADWLGFFRLYEQDLAARMGVTIGGLPALRARLSWTEPAVLGCGEHWPSSGVKRSAANRGDRRVELLCFAPEHVPGGAGAPPGASVYADPSYRRVPIQPGPGPHPLGGPCFELALQSDFFDDKVEGTLVRLRGGLYDLRHAVADAEHRAGFSMFHFHGIAKGTNYTATIECEGEEPVVLFEAASLDSYIAGVDDLEQQPNPIAIHVVRSPELRPPGGPYEIVDPIEDWDEDWDEE